jgi:NAD dependent epimerase/dehydratase family enzyme
MVSAMEQKPELLISGSAIGYYGDQGDTKLTEQSNHIADFSQQLCADWEHAALHALQ